jgi:hypothetical protein
MNIWLILHESYKLSIYHIYNTQSIKPTQLEYHKQNGKLLEPVELNRNIYVAYSQIRTLSWTKSLDNRGINT